MYDVIGTVIYYALTTLPFYTAAYIPFADKLRFSKMHTAAILYFVGVLACIAAALMYVCGVEYRVIEFTIAAGYLTLYCFIVKQNPFKLMFFGVFTADLMIVVRGIALFLSYNIFRFDESMRIAVGLICVVVFAVVFPIMYIPIKKDISIVFEDDDTKLWRTVWLLPLIITVIVFMYTYDISPVGVHRWQFISSRLLFAVGTLFIYTVILESLAQTREQAILKERADNASRIIQIYTERYDLLKSHIEEIKKERHNIRQHFNLIRACIDKNDINALNEYVSKYTQSMPKNIKGGYSANYAVDTIVGWYAEQAEMKNIKFDAEIKIPSKINISEPEICVVLGNLIENAVNACEKVKKTEPFIKIRGAYPGDDTVIFTVDNSCENPNEEDDVYEKNRTSGLGLQSVHDIAQKYNGIAEFKCRNNVFYASVMLNG